MIKGVWWEISRAASGQLCFIDGKAVSVDEKKESDDPVQSRVKDRIAILDTPKNGKRNEKKTSKTIVVAPEEDDAEVPEAPVKVIDSSGKETTKKGKTIDPETAIDKESTKAKPEKKAAPKPKTKTEAKPKSKIEAKSVAESKKKRSTIRNKKKVNSKQTELFADDTEASLSVSEFEAYIKDKAKWEVIDGGVKVFPWQSTIQMYLNHKDRKGISTKEFYTELEKVGYQMREHDNKHYVAAPEVENV